MMRHPNESLAEHEEELPDVVVEMAREALDRWDGWEYARRGADSAAGAAVYYSSLVVPADGYLTQREVASEFDISEVTIRNAKKDILPCVAEAADIDESDIQAALNDRHPRG